MHLVSTPSLSSQGLGYSFATRYVAGIFFTGLIFWYLLQVGRRYWKITGFWYLTGFFFCVHCLAWTEILTHVSRWKVIWFDAMIAEFVIYSILNHFMLRHVGKVRK